MAARRKKSGGDRSASGSARRRTPKPGTARKKATRKKLPVRVPKKLATRKQPVGGQSPAEHLSNTEPFPVVGIGASAGGLEAVTELLKHLPAETGMAYVFIQHLDPHHKSNLPAILARSTGLLVAEATDGVRLEPDHLYIMPPDRDMAIFHRAISLSPRATGRWPHRPVDRFFRSLADDCGPAAIGIVLSGTGSDGAIGVRAIKAAGGITIAQDEASARYPGMPHSAATDHVDLILPPAQIAQQLAEIGRQLRAGPPDGRPVVADDDGAERAFRRIFAVLRKSSGVDFTSYKRSTIERRIARRMVLHKLDDLARYADYLDEHPHEAEALFEDLLISVTGFFREPEVFETLKTRIFPDLLSHKPAGDAVRRGNLGKKGDRLVIEWVL